MKTLTDIHIKSRTLIVVFDMSRLSRNVGSL